MARSVLYMWMSLDGYVAGPDDDVGQALGRAVERLLSSVGDSGVRPSGPSGQTFDELMATSSWTAKPSSKKLDANTPDGVVTVPSIVTTVPSGIARASAIVGW